MRKLFLLALITGVVNYASAQCSEAENATMKKYAELTRTGDAQGCSQCAWLANLFCIAENGLYKNDKSEVQKAINDTKANIKLMGEPICCPELLTKNPKFGQQKNGATENGNETATTQNKTAQDIEALTNEVNSAINTIDNLNALDQTYGQLKEEIEKIEKLMNENSTLSKIEYQSENEINNEYNIKLVNLNKLAETHLAIKTKMQNLGYSASGELLNNSSSAGLGVIAGVGALASTHKKESKEFRNQKINNLNQSKKIYLFKLNNKDLELNNILSEEVLYSLLNQHEKNTDYTQFSNHFIIKGWYSQINIKDFKKLIPKFKQGTQGLTASSDYIGTIYYFHGKELPKDKNYSYKLNGNNVVEIQETYKTSKSFSKENLYDLQNELLQIINDYNEEFKIKPLKYSLKNKDINSINDDQKLTDAFSKMGLKSSGNIEKKTMLTNTEIVWTNGQNKIIVLKADIKHSHIGQ